MSVIVRPAVLADYAALYNDLGPPPRTVLAWAAVEHGRVIGLAGFIIKRGNRAMVFGHITPALLKHKRFIVRSARMLATHARRFRAIAIADPKVAMSRQLIEHVMGGRYLDTWPEGEVFTWTH